MQKISKYIGLTRRIKLGLGGLGVAVQECLVRLPPVRVVRSAAKGCLRPERVVLPGSHPYCAPLAHHMLEQTLD